jgi:SAM-dependent methyltransferase
VPILERAKIEHSIFHQVQGTLSRLGFDLQQHHSILDFGCGSGHDVYELRDIGYQAFGVDLHDFLQLRSPDDRQWFRLSRDPCIYRLPYPDNHFDVIYSNQVLEHVVYYEPALQEMRRVLKPNGICIHIFPARWRVIEAHFRAPFGGAIRWEPWFKFWAMLGVHNPGLPAGLSAKEHAAINWKASRTNYTYHSHKELRFFFSLFFSRVTFAEKEFVGATLAASRVSRLTHSIAKVFPPIFWFYRQFHTKVAVLSGYSDPERSRDGVILY